MASTLLAGVIQPSPLADYVFEQTKLLSDLYKTEALVEDQVLGNWLETEGNLTYDAPKWDSLDRTVEENTITEDEAVMFGGSGVTPQAIATHRETAVRVERNQIWSASKLSKYFNNRQRDPLMAIGQDIAGYWDFRFQAYFLATMAGIFADNDAAAAGGDTHTQGDLTLDVSGSSFADGVTNFTAENFLDALQLMGDAQKDLGLMMCHSITYNKMLKEDLFDDMRDSRFDPNIRTFMGMPVIYNDQMPGTGFVRDSYIFKRGAIGVARAQPDRPIEFAYAPEGGGGAGQESIFSRVRWCLHPYGHRFLSGTITGATPNNTNLALAANWGRRAPERKQVGIVRLRTREA